jgi:hypothetical protein
MIIVYSEGIDIREQIGNLLRSMFKEVDHVEKDSE